MNIRPIHLVIVGLALFSACKKDPETRNQLQYLTEIKQTNGSSTQTIGSIQYGTDHLISSISMGGEYLALKRNTSKEVNSFSYDPDISHQNAIEVKANYSASGLPQSGVCRYTNTIQTGTDPYQIQDSIIYQVNNGRISAIKLFDRRHVFLNSKSVQLIRTDTTRKFEFTYSSGNIVQIIDSNPTRTVKRDFTFGTKKSPFHGVKVSSLVNPFGFITLYAGNELLKEKVTNVGENRTEETDFNYQYDNAGYPTSAIVTHTRTGQAPWSYTLNYLYKTNL